jgi:hypothetical protein
MKMNPITALLRIDWSGPKLRALDLALALGALGYGLYDGSRLLIWFGALAVFFSLLNPMGRLQRGLARFRRPAGGR